MKKRKDKDKKKKKSRSKRRAPVIGCARGLWQKWSICCRIFCNVMPEANVLQILVGNAGFGRSDNSPIINVHCSGESASQKGEFINNVLPLSFRIPEFNKFQQI